MPTIDYQNRDDSNRETGFLRSLFGPSKKEIWSQLADQISGNFIAGSGFFGKDKVVANVEQWTVTLDTFSRSQGKSSTTYTRMRAPYVNKDNFRFTIYRSGFFTAIGEMLGMTDILIGHPPFDDAFVIKASDASRVRALLSDEKIRALFEAQPRIRVEVKDDEGWFGTRFPQGVDELYFETMGVVKDLEQLSGLFELFSAILHQLCQIGSAYETDPGVSL